LWIEGSPCGYSSSWKYLFNSSSISSTKQGLGDSFIEGSNCNRKYFATPSIKIILLIWCIVASWGVFQYWPLSSTNFPSLIIVHSQLILALTSSTIVLPIQPWFHLMAIEIDQQRMCGNPIVMVLMCKQMNTRTPLCCWPRHESFGRNDLKVQDFGYASLDEVVGVLTVH